MLPSGHFMCSRIASLSMGRIFLRVGVIAGLISCVTQIFPTGDLHGRYMAKHQPAAVAAMEGLFTSEKGAGIVLMGQPDEERQAHRQPDGRKQRFELPDLWNNPGRSHRVSISFPETSGPRRSAFVLRVPHHGRTGHVFRVADGAVAHSCSGAASSSTARWMLWPLLLSLPASLHRQYRRMDDSRNRPSTLDRLRPGTNFGRVFKPRFSGQHACSHCWVSWACTRFSPFCLLFWSIAPSTKGQVALQTRRTLWQL